MTGAKKSVFLARQQREKIFEIRSYGELIFRTASLNFEQLFLSYETFFQKIFLAQIITNG